MITLLALLPNIAIRAGFCDRQNDERCVLALVARKLSCYPPSDLSQRDFARHDAAATTAMIFSARHLRMCGAPSLSSVQIQCLFHEEA
jgi:hypothetical protein